MSLSRCSRCKNLEAHLTPAGLCSVCAGTEDTAEPTSAASPAPEPGAHDATADYVSPAEAATRTNPPEAGTLSAPAWPAASLPVSPTGYELITLLGDGGMGDVYLARELASGRSVAMKFLRRPDHPTDFERFVTELQVLADLEHPNVVRMFGHDFYRVNPFFTMEYLPAGSLARAIRGTVVPVADAVALIRTVAGAVAHAHGHGAGVLHRDLKPSNILLAKAEGGGGKADPESASSSALPSLPSAFVPKVADFGLAKRLDQSDGPTRTSSSLGTPGYMPPEQISRKNGEVGFPADVYGLGATLYHLLTGRAPFVGSSPEEVIVQVLNDAPPRPRALRPDVPLALEAVVLKCLEKDPADRYQTVAAFLADLDAAAAGRGTVAPQLTRVRRARLWAGRHRRRIGAAATVALVVGVAFALGAYRARQGEPDPLPAIEKELDAGGTVELLRKDGRPRRPRWPVGEGQLSPSETKDGTTALRTQGLVFLELVPDPRRDRYRLTAYLRNLYANPMDGFVGVYAGGDAVAAPSGGSVYPAVLTEFRESYSLNELKYPKEQAYHGVQLMTATAAARAGQVASLGPGHGRGSRPFKPRPDDPPWWVVALDVTPEGVEMFCAVEGEELAFVTRVTAEEIAAARQVARARLAQIADPPVPVPEWSPRKPLGIWAYDSVVSFKNVTIGPIPARNGGPKP